MLILVLCAVLAQTAPVDVKAVEPVSVRADAVVVPITCDAKITAPVKADAKAGVAAKPAALVATAKPAKGGPELKPAVDPPADPIAPGTVYYVPEGVKFAIEDESVSFISTVVDVDHKPTGARTYRIEGAAHE